MFDKLYKKMSTLSNLKLAWARLKTAQNIYYKNYYRNIFLAYELNYEENLKQLSKRLMSGTYEPSDILRFYIPKHSGLHRPITFLHLDDLIVYQAIANIIAEKFWNKRLELQNLVSYSNLFSNDGKKSIFLFEKWQYGYRNFIKIIRNFYKKGNTWVAHFDLAAYYDSIDLKLLFEQISSTTYKDFTNNSIKYISRWTTHKSKKLYHGIPQGPISSNLIGEIYLLPIDQKMVKKAIKYVRYVDDIKIFGKTKEEVQKGIIFLEQECKERGLIPHAKKYEIINATTIKDAIGKFPSLQSDEKKVIFKNEKEAYKLFANAFTPSDYSFFDVSRVRYILKTSKENEGIIKLIIDRIEQHPELVDEFCIFLSNYRDRENIAIQIYNKTIAKRVVYSYVEGKYWQLLAEFKITNEIRRKYIILAMARLTENRNEYSLKLGLYKFLCTSGDSLILKWLPNESSCLIQMMVIPYISTSLYESIEFKKLLKVLFSRSNYDAPLAMIKEILFNDKWDLLADIGTSYKDDTGVIANSLGHSHDFNPIEKILNKTYTTKFKKWKRFLGNHYAHANYLAYLAHQAFFIERNAWINYTCAFIEIVFRDFVSLLKNKGFPQFPTVAPRGGLLDLGNLLNNKNIASAFPSIVGGFRKINKRRRNAPTSHAFDKKTLQKSEPVTQKEQKNLVGFFNNSLNKLLMEIDKYV